MKEAIGVSPFGGDLNKFPCRIADAFVVLQQEQSRVDNLMRSKKRAPLQFPKGKRRA